MIKLIWATTFDYLFYGLPTFFHSQIFRKDSPSFISKNPREESIVLIPGILQRWNIFRHLIPILNINNYSVWTVKDLKRNIMSIEETAKLVTQTINENNLLNVVLIGHSKGGLVGKYVLDYLNTDGRVKKVIAIGVPFHGTKMAYKFFSKGYKELRPNSEIVSELFTQKNFNGKITSIYTEFDGTIVPSNSAVLEGAKNIKVNIWGHQRMLFNKVTEEIILNELVN